ncbi:hypothetical protein GH810_02885 [Acetobacterium paludosum]|uniref:Uncharacterized protein n=2 Tax=Acetobacterium paludosum TaxID=52693 RepID=A0A923KNM1_9FIRM|nr:hypothetical protein [Acetobacterium paludosum]
MGNSEYSNYVIGKNGVEYEDLVALNKMQDMTDRLLTKREFRMLTAIYDMATKRIIKELRKESSTISSHNNIKTALGLCGCKHCYEKGSKQAEIQATMSNNLFKTEEHFLICSKHAAGFERGQHED